MEFNDGSSNRVLTDPDAQVQVGRTLFAYRACGRKADTSFAHHRSLRNKFKATLLYHYVYSDTSPEVQANLFLDTLQHTLYPGEMVCIDVETDPKYGAFTTHNVVDFVQRWLAVVEPTLHTKAWIYSGKELMSALTPVIGDRVVWGARYSSNPPEFKYDIWQYTDSGAFPGSSGNGDVSRTNLSAEELLARCGIASPKEPTMPKYTYEPTKEQVEALLNWHRSQLGKGSYEHPPGSNNTEYGEEYGFNGVAWCVIEASIGCKRVGSPFRFASTWEARRDAERHGAWFQTPKPGMGAMHVTTQTTGHWGTVESVHSNGDITTIEGNTSPDSSGNQRDGDGVYRKRRSRSYWAGFAAYPWPVVSTPIPTPIPKPKEEDMGPAIVNSADGKQYAYVVGDDRAAWEYGRVGHADTNAAGWRKIGGTWTSGLSAVGNKDGTITLCGRGTDGHLWQFTLDLLGNVTAKTDRGGHIYAPA